MTQPPANISSLSQLQEPGCGHHEPDIEDDISSKVIYRIFFKFNPSWCYQGS